MVGHGRILVRPGSGRELEWALADQGADGAGPRKPAVTRPLLWHALCFCVGIGLGTGTPWCHRGWLIAAGVALVPAGLCRFAGRCAFVVGLVTVLGLGAWRAGVAVERWEREPLRHWVGRGVTVWGTVVSPPRRVAPTRQRFDLEIGRLMPDGGRAVAVRGRVRMSAEGGATVALGDRVRFATELREPHGAGDPGQYSPRRHLASDGVLATCYAADGVEVTAHGAGRWWDMLSQALRSRLCGAVERTMPGPDAKRWAGLLNGLVFGVYAAPVDPQVEESFRRAGVVHVLVASGTQVSLLLLVVFLFARLLPLPLFVPLAGGVALVGAYVLVTGFEPSILRAAVMGLTVIGALLTGRDYDLPTALALSAALLLAAKPLGLFDVGFQLSYAATAGLLLIGLPLMAWLTTRVGRFVAALVSFTLAAQLFVAPLLVLHFRQLSLIGLVANLPVIPVCGVLVGLGLAASVAGNVVAPLAVGLNMVSKLVLSGVVTTVGWFSRVPGGFRSPLVWSPTEVALWCAGLCALSVGLGRPRWLSWWSRERVVLVLVAAVAASSCWRAYRLATAELQVVVLDVGQGDAILLRGPTGRSFLVDGGPAYTRDGEEVDAGRDQVVPALMLLGVRRLAAVIGTHQHADHIGGLPSVLAAYPTQRLLLPDMPASEPAVRNLLAAARKQGLAPERLSRGALLDLGGGARVYVLWPPRAPVEGTGSDVNNNVVVLKVVYGRVSFLLTSDLERRGEELLLRHGGDLAATVLKVPHQGAEDSTSDGLLDAVQPLYAAVSVGDNSYGQPAASILSRLRERGIETARTDLDGMVTYRTDGRTIRVATYGRR